MPYEYSRKSIKAARVLELVAAVTLSPMIGLLRILRTLHVGGGRLSKQRRARTRPANILLIEPFQMGDVLSLSVLLEPLKTEFPQCRITVLTQPKNAHVFSCDPRVEQTITCPFPWANYSGKSGRLGDWCRLLGTILRLGLRGFDLGIDTRGEVRSHIMLVLTECRERVGYTNYMGSNMEIRGLLLTSSAALLPSDHRHRLNLQVLASYLGTPAPEPQYPSLHTAGLAPVRIVEHQLQIVVHHGGGSQFKRWPTENWTWLSRELTKSGEVHLIFIGSPQEEAELVALSEQLPAAYSTVKVTSYSELIQLIKGADLFIGLDSGPMNLAVCLGTPVLAIFGPGDSKTWGPRGRLDRFLHAVSELPADPNFEARAASTGYNPTAMVRKEEVLACATSQIQMLKASLHTSPAVPGERIPAK